MKISSFKDRFTKLISPLTVEFENFDSTRVTNFDLTLLENLLNALVDGHGLFNLMYIQKIYSEIYLIQVGMNDPGKSSDIHFKIDSKVRSNVVMYNGRKNPIDKTEDLDWKITINNRDKPN